MLLALVLVLSGVWFFFFMLSLPVQVMRQSLKNESNVFVSRVPVRINIIPAAFVVAPNRWQWVSGHCPRWRS